jgi:RNA polymerase primary sigma factor
MVNSAPRSAGAAPDRRTKAEQVDSVGWYLKHIGRVPLLTPGQQVELAKRIEAGLYARQHLDHAADDGQALADQFRAELEEIAGDGQQAEQHMIEANLRLVVATARRYTGGGVEFADLISEGNRGLIRAVQMFDHTKGFAFSTYATWWIRQTIRRAIEANSRTIRLPSHVHDALRRLRVAERDLEQKLNRTPTADELAAALDQTSQRVQYLLHVRRRPFSLDIPVDEEGRTSLADVILDIDAPDPADVVVERRFGKAIRQVLARVLPARETKIVVLRYGLVDGQPHTLDEVAGMFELSRERIRQIEKDALLKLRTPAVRRALRDWTS